MFATLYFLYYDHMRGIINKLFNFFFFVIELLDFKFVQRVVNVSSRAGLLKIIKSEEIRKKLLDPNLTIETITNNLNQFIE